MNFPLKKIFKQFFQLETIYWKCAFRHVLFKYDTNYVANNVDNLCLFLKVYLCMYLLLIIQCNEYHKSIISCMNDKLHPQFDILIYLCPLIDYLDSIISFPFFLGVFWHWNLVTSLDAKHDKVYVEELISRLVFHFGPAWFFIFSQIISWEVRH